MNPFSSPLTAPPTSPQPPMSPIKRGLKRKVSLTTTNTVDSSRAGAPETPTKRVPIIDLCTPSPAASKVFDLLGLGRRPLAEVGVPNGALSSAADDEVSGKAVVEAEKERSSFEGYLALCRMTRQASQRSLPTRQPTSKAVHQASVPTEDGAEDVMVDSNAGGDEAEEKETEEEKQRRLREYRERNVRAVVGRSRGAVVGGRMAPGKSFIRTARFPRDQQTSVTETNSETSTEPAETTSTRASTSLVPIDTLPRIRDRYLESFVSHQHEDVMYVEPNPEHTAFRRRDWSPIYACAYSHAAKTASNEGPKLLALASESGTIKLVDTRYNATQHQSSAPGTYSSELYPHQNAIFDVQWDEADERLLTASGDQTGAVHRLGEGEVRRDAVLTGHTSSVKSCAWYDQNTVLTAGRDGNILIFDLRTTGFWADSGGMDEQRFARALQGNHAGGYWDKGKINPVMTVRNAHGENCGKKVSARSAVRSVTSLLALKSDRNVIASGGSADGIVKFWDLRAQLASTRRIYVSESVSQTLDRTADRGKRSRGVVSLVEAKGNIYAMCNDARIHSHSIQSPQLALPTYYTHPSLDSSSFYLKLAVSPCENFLACGASEGRFVTWGIERDFLGRWDWNRGKGDEVVNAVEGVECGWGGHSRQVGAMDWAVDQIATGSDDYSSRIWRPNPSVVQQMRDGSPEGSYWAGSVKR